MPLTTTRAAPATASAAPRASRDVRRSSSRVGPRSMSATGSTTISSAAFVAVEAAIPQLARTNAAPKPRMPIQAIVHRSRGVGGGAGAGQELARVLGTVDPGRLDVDRLEACLRELLPVLTLAEGAGDAADPQLDALADCGRHLAADDDVGDGEPTPRPQHAERLGKDAVLVRREIDDTVGDDDVDGPGRQRDVLDLASQELDVLDARLPLVVPRQREHLVGHVQPVRLARRPDPLGGQEDVDAPTRAEVQHRLPWPEVGERRRVAAAERRDDRLRGKPRRLAGCVEVRRDRVALAPARGASAAGAAARDPLSRPPVLLLDDLLEGLVRHAVPPPIGSPLECRRSYLDNSINVKLFLAAGRPGLSTAIHNG